MVFEVIGALVIWFAIAIGVRVYSRHYLQEAQGDPGFEEWLRGRPKLAYFAVRPDALHLVRRALLEGIAEAGVVVVAEGETPWPRYGLELGIERIAPDVLALVVEGGAPRRGTRGATELLAIVERAAQVAPGAVVELWLHGQVHRPSGTTRNPRRKPLDRDRVGWVGRPDGEGLHLERMVGIPAWANPSVRAA